MRHLEDYRGFFRTATSDLFPKASLFFRGLIQGNKRNVERICELVPRSEYQSLHHFLSVSPWKDRPIRLQHMRFVARMLGGSDVSCLILDDSAFLKKGKQSVGVTRQWAGCAGKVDNCQVGVFAALSRGRFACLLDGRLFLPRLWTKDETRCTKASIPASDRQYQPKWVHALDLIGEADAAGVRYDWVVVDGGYGHNRVFLRKLKEMGKTYLAEVHSNQRIYLEKPTKKPLFPNHSHDGIRRLSGFRRPVKVRDWVASQPEACWTKVRVRNTTKGVLSSEILHRRIWVFSGRKGQYDQLHLLVRRDRDGKGRITRIKYSLSNAPETTSPVVLVQRQASRFWVEHCFREGKQDLGLKDYQVRKWRAWQHHMTMVLLMAGWMLRMRMDFRKCIPFLSTADLRLIVRGLLPKKAADFWTTIGQTIVRHLQRGWIPPGST